MKRMISVLAILCLLAALACTVSAAPQRLVDKAELLTENEFDSIERQLDKLSNRQEMDIVIVTVESTDGEDMQDFADDYYDYNGFCEDGILLLVSMEDSDWYISTTGYGIDVITDAGLKYMSRQFVPYLSGGDYAQAFETFIELCDDFIRQADSGDPYDSHNLPKEDFRVVLNLVIALILGLIAGLIVTGIMKGQLKTVRQQAKADDYVTPGSLQLSYSRDLYLYTHTDRREKPKSGGSSTHTSSSGTTHGGGGGKF